MDELLIDSIESLQTVSGAYASKPKYFFSGD